MIPPWLTHQIQQGKLPGLRPVSRHAPFGVSLRANAYRIHGVEQVWLNFRSDPTRPVASASWICAPSYSPEVALLTEPIASQMCPRCQSVLDADAICGRPVHGEPVVYYAEKDGLIKIGGTRRLGFRVADLKATLLAAEVLPKGHSPIPLEMQRHSQFEHLRVSEGPTPREWYAPGDDLMAHIESLDRQPASQVPA